MRVDTPQIYWHGKSESIMSCDFLPGHNMLVTCGPDNEEDLYVRVSPLKLIFIGFNMEKI